MTKETSNQQPSILNAIAQTHENHQFTAMGPPNFMARIPQQFSVRLSMIHLSEILRQALEIVEYIDDGDDIILSSNQSQGLPPSTQ